MSEEKAAAVAEAKKAGDARERGRARLLARHEREVEQEVLMHVAKERARLRPPPSVEAKSRGETDQMVAMAANAYERNNPGQSTRFVFAPENRKLHSGIPKARMRGYRPVRVADLALEDAEAIFGPPDQPVQVYDTQLMATPIENKRRRRELLDTRAEEQTNVSRRAMAEREGIESVGRTRDRLGRDVGVRAMGEIKQSTELKDFTKLPEARKGE